MRSRRARLAGAGIALAALVVVVVVAAPGGEAEAPEGAAPTATAPVVRTDLVARRVVDGVLGHLEVDGGLVARVAGRLTDLRPEGEVVAPGRALCALDGEPVLLLAGDRPVTRDLVLGLRGPDVAQLNATFGLEGDAFTPATADALRAAQEAAGGTPTGVLRPSHAVVLPGPARIGARRVVDGADVEPGTEVAALAVDELVVVVDLQAGDRDSVAAGDEVFVALPSGDEVPGTVRSVASVAEEAEEEGAPQTVEVVVALDEPDAVDGLTGAAVDVSITDQTAEDVLAVPVTALVALAEGGYGVEVLRPGGNRLVGVDVGLFSDADDLVEVDGDLRVGDRVVVPA